MAIVAYHVVEHDGGWAYTVDGVSRKRFRPMRRRSRPPSAPRPSSARRAPPKRSNMKPAAGKWRVEHAEGADRPATEVIDDTND